MQKTDTFYYFQFGYEHVYTFNSKILSCCTHSLSIQRVKSTLSGIIFWQHGVSTNVNLQTTITTPVLASKWQGLVSCVFDHKGNGLLWSLSNIEYCQCWCSQRRQMHKALIVIRKTKSSVHIVSLMTIKFGRLETTCWKYTHKTSFNQFSDVYLQHKCNLLDNHGLKIVITIDK